MVKSKTGLACLVIVLWLSACGPAVGGPAAGTANTRAWFDAPLPETVFYPPNPCQIVAHGGSPVGIAAFELDINGAVTTVPSRIRRVHWPHSRNCGLRCPADMLRLRAQERSGNWAGRRNQPDHTGWRHAQPAGPGAGSTGDRLRDERGAGRRIRGVGGDLGGLCGR
jgi:hypothetical protein